MKLKLSLSVLTIALATLSTVASAKEISSTTDVTVSQTDCVTGEQEVSIIGGAVGGTVGGAGGAIVGNMVGGRTGGWIGGLVGSAVGGAVGSKGRTTYDCSVVVDNQGTPTLVRSITHEEVKKGDNVKLHALSDGTFHISSNKN
jgi:phage tail tape-measure protein